MSVTSCLESMGSVQINGDKDSANEEEQAGGGPVWPSGNLQAGKQKDLGSIQLLLSFLFKDCF